jgi:ABC-2 type transport system permease protein
MTALLVSEVRRILRSPRFLIFTVGLPLVYFLIFSGIYAPDGGTAVAALMVMMAAFGAISASINVGGRVVNERRIGWNRQLRLTPLPGWGYLRVKAVAAMVVVRPALWLVVVGALVTVRYRRDALRV